MAHVLEPLSCLRACGRARWNSRFLALTWPWAGCCSFLILIKRGQQEQTRQTGYYMNLKCFCKTKEPVRRDNQQNGKKKYLQSTCLQIISAYNVQETQKLIKCNNKTTCLAREQKTWMSWSPKRNTDGQQTHTQMVTSISKSKLQWDVPSPQLERPGRLWRRVLHTFSVTVKRCSHFMTKYQQALLILHKWNSRIFTEITWFFYNSMTTLSENT